jgi:hypothetical protein
MCTLSLLIAYNTCAACNAGYIGHHNLPIAEKYPELVKTLICAESKYAPLTLSAGIVTNKKDGKKSMKPVAMLPAMTEYWLAFLIQ